MTTTRLRITPEEYLRLPNAEPPWLEYYRGEVIEKPLPNSAHYAISGFLTFRLGQYQLVHGGRFGNEGRTRFAAVEVAYLLPDISYYRAGTRWRDGELLLPPTLAIEIASPGQPERYYSERVSFFLQNGIEEVWVVNPSARSVRVVSGADSDEVHRDGECRSEALPGFTVPLHELFAELDSEFA